jgi:hypothetical protein
MKIIAAVGLALAVVYTITVRTAAFLGSLFLILLSIIGLYDLLIHPFVKKQQEENSGRRVSA